MSRAPDYWNEHDYPQRSPTANVHAVSDWHGSGNVCQLCKREIPHGDGWGYADDGPLCHPDDPALPDCYTLWTVYGTRPLDEAQARHRADSVQAEHVMLTSVRDLVDHARKVSSSPSMSVYLADIERALGRVVRRPHKRGQRDD